MSSIISLIKKTLPSHWLIILVILLIPFIFPTSVLDPGVFPRLVLLILTTLVFFIFFLTKISKNKTFNFGIFKNSLTAFYAAYILYSGISIFFSINYSEAISEWSKNFAFFIVFIVFVIYINELQNPKEFISKVAIVFEILASIIGFLQIALIINNGQLTHESTYIVRIPFGHRNLFAEVLFLASPFVFYGIYSFSGWWKRIAIFSAILSVGLITFLLARSSWAALIVGFFVSFLVLLNYYKYFAVNLTFFKKISIYFASGFALIFISLLLFSVFGNTETLKKQTWWITNYRFGSSLERIEIWEKSLEMYRDNPVFGVGTGNWKINIPHYKIDDIASPENEERAKGISQGLVNFQRPHNDFLWVASENGLPGFLCYSAIFVLAFLLIFQIIFKSVSLEEKFFSLFMLYGLVGYVVIAMVSFPKERIEHTIFLLIIFALILNTHFKIKPKQIILKRKTINYISIPLVIVLGFASVMSFQKIKSEYFLKKAFTYREIENWQKVIDYERKAENFFSTIDNTSVPLKWYSGSAYFNMNQLDNAFEEFQKSFAFNPNQVHVLNNLATCYELKGNHQKSEEFYQKALDISPDFQDALLNLSIVYFNSNRFESSFQTIRKMKYDAENKKYITAIDVILREKINRLKSQIAEIEITKSLERISNASDWLEKVYRQSITDKTEYDRQLLIECVYLMEIVDKSITTQRATYFKKKFGLTENV